MSKVDSRSDEKKAVVPCYQSARLHDQKAVNESVKKSESESSKDSDITAEGFKQKDTDAEAVTEDEVKLIAQVEVEVEPAVKGIHEKKDEEELKLTEADKQ
ncbi:uncharacterized protein BDCG_03102 [Blastomyces dermatitidis ER-3]|uniref:Uncharacterized protein n=1 Tax=Ajellomyces dermatitidis (strain ER-3 / ATCC MYA-2586) TaxID=559297 RepID=A0ABP2EVI2_AJEDR|nr:uncharacterized protein BDCG_03102 [Blastomyces dermatitidis ER-3]EEQ87982.2 hypothetical protein BDCG_03102 [Blastomyces dermatitidis ER-3]